MYLKRLEIKGFKSFADHTEISLNPGINIIVGPNGCGKSNIVDAIRWVLGEANVRHLRGHKNEDVIFNGTDKKKALGMAQVDMTVDNLGGNLPLEYSEVTVSRKIFRSGESEFYLNKSKVRMKDIVRLYTDTGLGKKGYSIISQGELERVLNGQPIDRRFMLEEAAGTMKYRHQRDEVQQRIMATAQDLLRVEDILSELRNRKADLFTKAQKAQAYLAMREEYNNLGKKVMAYRLKELSDNLSTRNTELTLKHSDLTEISSGLENLNISLRHAQSLQEKQRVYLGQLRENKHELESGLNRMGAEIKLSQERIKNHSERIQAASHDSEKYAHRLEKLEKDMELKIADFNQERVHYENKQDEAKQLLDDIKKLECSINEQEKILQRHHQLVFERANRESKIKNEITALDHKIKKAQEKRERLIIRLEEGEEQLKILARNAADLQVQRDKHYTAKEKWDKVVAEAEIQKKEYLDSQTATDREYENISSERLKLEHKILVLKELQQSYAGYSDGVRSLLKSYERGEIGLQGIKGLVADLIEVPPGMELAISIALGKGMENIVVETSESARQAIQFLKKRRWGRVTFLPLDVLRIKNMQSPIKQEILAETGVLGLAVDLVKYELEYEKAVAYLLGRVLLVREMDCGLRVFKKFSYPLRIVTLEGEIINTNGAMTGGTQHQSKSSPLQRKQEEKSISQRLAILRQSEVKNRARATELSTQLKVLDNRLSEGKNGQAEAEFQL
ncbi:MAG: chromosome segregation protein SMC, partial [Syntrophomonas sp.]